MNRPDWWDCDLLFTSHVELRMEERSFSELELRRMLDVASEVIPGRVPGRFEVRTRHRGKAWVVVLEPDLEEQVVHVVTAFTEDMQR